MSDNKHEIPTAAGDQKKDARRHRRPGKHRPRNKAESTAQTVENELPAAELISEDTAETDIENDVLDAAPAVFEAASAPDADGDADSAQAPVTTPEQEASDEQEMTEVIGVRFRSSGKIYYFDNCGLQYPLGCHAIVDTARGMEYGEVAMSNRMVPTSELVLPLREALRIATPEDDRHHAENKQKEADAAEIWNKKIAQHNLEMKLIDIECTFDNSKILFYFTAEGRVDFRDLVKDLASVFRCRIELRQMGIRDEAKILGGLGVCGRPFCCHSFLPDFVQVSIKMAKEQNLSLNSAKISGACGRLMCCLRYEYDTYLEEAKLTPKVDSLVRTPDGLGTVVEAKPLLGLVKVQLANSPDAAPLVYSRDLVKIHKPGDPIDDPVIPPTPVPKESGTANKAPENKKQDQQPRRQAQQPKKRQNEGADMKKAPEAEKESKKTDKNAKQERPAERAVKQDKAPRADKPQQDAAKSGKSEPPKAERKYTIQRASDNAAQENAAPKKRDGNYHRRRNHPPKDRKEKKSGEQS